MHEASLAYAALSPEAKAEYAKRGAVATRAARAGATHPFGDHTRRAMRRVARDRMRIALQEMAEGRKALCDIASAAGESTLAVPMDVCSFSGGAAAIETSMANIADLNRQLRLEAACLRMEEKKIDDALVRWHDTEGQ